VDARWSGGMGRLRRGVPALLAVAALGAGGQAAAAAHRAGAAAPPTKAASTAGIISTVAGGPGGPGNAAAVSLNTPCGVSFAPGHLYIASQQAVRQVSPRTGRLTTLAGTNSAGPPGDGGPAASASLNTCGVAVDHSGNLVIADSGGNRIRVAAAVTGTFYGQSMTAGDIYTIAGNGHHGFTGDGGPAASAELDRPATVAVDAAGNVVIADTNNVRIRVIAASTGTFYGRSMTAGDIYTVAGGGAPLGDGGPATSAQLSGPYGVTLDSAGNLVICDAGHARIRVVAAKTGTFYGQSMTAGDIYTIAGNGKAGFAGDGGPATGAELDNPLGLAFDHSGDLVFADTNNQRIRVVAGSTGTFYGQSMTAGDIYTIAGNGTLGFSGDGGPATGAELNNPQGVAVDASGNLVIADNDNARARVLAASTGTFYRRSMTAGDIYTIAGNGSLGFSGDGGLATSGQLSGPQGVVTDRSGNLVIGDTGNDRVRVAAGSTGTFYGRSMTAGDIYTVAGNGTPGFSGDGGPANSAALNQPAGVAADASGNLVIADTNNERVRVVAGSTGTFYGQAMTARHIYTVAGDGSTGGTGDGGPATGASLDGPAGVAVDAAGNLVVANSGDGLIRVVAASTGTFYGQAMTAGHIYLVAGGGSGALGDGGPATKAVLVDPGEVAMAATGNLVIADAGDSRIRVVAVRHGTFYGQPMVAGDIYTVAGNGFVGFSGDGGPATGARLDGPTGVAVDAAGNLLIADHGNARLRVVARATSTFYGQAMVAGHIYTVAGNGSAGFSGDGGPATSAELFAPWGVAVDGSNLVIGDPANNRVRLVTG
jgi:trimeric autotransporter adhesin